jgi:hypothetical protein
LATFLTAFVAFFFVPTLFETGFLIFDFADDEVFGIGVDLAFLATVPLLRFANAFTAVLRFGLAILKSWSKLLV